MELKVKLSKFETPIFQLDGGETRDPVSSLSSGSCKPIKKITKSNVKVLVLFPKEISQEERNALDTLLSSLMNGVEGIRVKKWPGFQKIFGSKLILERETYGIQDQYVRNILRILNDNAKAYDFFVVYMPEPTKSRLGGPYFMVKAYTIVNRIKEQILIKPTINKIIRYTNQRDLLSYNDLVWNFALSIFTKIGGVPWRLKSPMSPVDVFIALSTIIKPEQLGVKRKAGIAALQLYNNWGEYEQSIHGELMFIYEEDKGVLDVDYESSEDLVRLILTIAKNIKGKNVVVHLSDLYSKGFHTLLYDTLTQQGAASVKIIRIQAESPLRLYKNIEDASQAWPMVACYWFLKPGKIAHLYTSGRWKYYIHKAPYAVPKHTIRPIQISLEYPQHSELTLNDLRDILWLTKLYTYMIDAPRARMPADLKLCHRYAQIIASERNVGTPEDITYLY